MWASAMNKFTKEELQELKSLWEPESDWERLSELQCLLRDTIQSIIERSCVHEWITLEIREKIILNPGEDFPVECQKCGLIYSG